MKKTLTDEQKEHIYENFDSSEILEAVDAVDKLRGLFADRDICRPPEIREDLMNLHGVVFESITQNGTHEEEANMLEMVIDIEDVLVDAREAIEQISDVMDRLQALVPDLEES